MVTFASELPAPARILIVDDHEDSRVVTRLVLEHAGYVVDEAADGESGLAIAIDRPPDLVIVDIVLPAIDGLQLSRLLRAHPRTCDARIVAVTALGRTSVRDDAARAGCDAFLLKPVQVASLRATVLEQLLESKTKGQYSRA
jgi:two-component system cell cycle response regulator DivK